MRGKQIKKLDTTNLLNANFYIGVSEFKTAHPVLLHPQTQEECVVGIRASISMPGAVSDEILIRKKRYVDGAFTRPHILELAYSSFSATHVLVVTNQDKNTEDILWWDKLLTQTRGRFRMSKSLYSVALQRRKIRHDWVEKALKENEIPLCLV